jgi:hypothetical protein
MNRREVFGAALATGAAAVSGLPVSAAPAREPDGWLICCGPNYSKVIPDGELEIWKFNWKTLLMEGRAEIVPLYKGDPVAKEQLTFLSREELYSTNIIRREY